MRLPLVAICGVLLVGAGPGSSTPLHVDPDGTTSYASPVPSVSNPQIDVPATDDGSWTRLFPSPNINPGRSWATAICDPLRERMLVFGGMHYGGIVDNKVWALALSGSPAWTVLATTGAPPPGLHYHTAIYDPVRDQMVLFGGEPSGGIGFLSDVWSLTLSGIPAWSNITPPGTGPSGRHVHSAIYDPVGDRMVVFGGFDGTFGLNDVWALSLQGAGWAELAPSGYLPKGRWGHSAVYDPVRQRMVVFGGWSPPLGGANDTWALALSGALEWSEISPPGSPPINREYHTAIYDPAHDRMVVFAGDAGGGFFNDLWSLSLSGTPAWSALTPIGGPPLMRHGHTAIYDPARARMMMFGGEVDSGSDDDTWELRWEQPTALEYSGLYAEQQGRAVDLSWFSSMRLDFQIYRADEAGAAYSKINEAPVFGSGDLSYLDTAVRPSTSYWYRLGFVDVTGRQMMSDPVTASTGPWEEEEERVHFTSVGPSPARGDMAVRFSLPQRGWTRLSVYDAAGRLIRVLVDGQQEKGDHTLTWSGRDTQAKRVGSGVYFVRLSDGRATDTRRIVVLR